MAWITRWKYKMVSVQPGVGADLEHLDNSLYEGWEPYATTWDGTTFDHHLRKWVTQKERKP